MRQAVRRALVSVSDKQGLAEFARGLAAGGVEILSTGGTAAFLADAGVPVRDVADYTGFPEMLDGRVKTLHPRVHGGLLFRRDVPAHAAQAAAHGILPIDLLVVNLYPFEATVAKPGVAFAEAIENIDIGGPAMIRSAAKNHAAVGVVTDPGQYEATLAELREGGLSPEFLQRLAAAAFARTAAYDAAIAAYFARLGGEDADFPAELTLRYRRQALLRYGENPHQKAAVYVDPHWRGATAVGARQLHGKELSYNNLLDLDSALALAREFDRPAVAILKHNNPCGCAVAETLERAFRNAWAGDPVSAFGSVIGMNRVVDAATAAALVEPGRFVEAIVAPDFHPEAVRLLSTVPTWKANVRLLAAGDFAAEQSFRHGAPLSRPIEGGLLRQTPDVDFDSLDRAKLVTRREPTPAERRDLEFAWIVAKHVRSNAIVLAKDEQLVGCGAGQMSRVDAGRIALEKAGARARGAVLGSDAFFPFRDNVDQAAAAGIAAVVQPGGSKRDQEAIDACDEHGMAMLFAGVRHFRH